MFQMTMKQFVKGGSYVPMQMCSSIEEGKELIASEERIFTNSIEDGDTFVDAAGNITRELKVWLGRKSITYRIVTLRRS